MNINSPSPPLRDTFCTAIEYPCTETEKSTINVASINNSVWSKYNNIYRGCESSVNMLPTGVYKIDSDGNGIFFTKAAIETDELLELPDTASDEIIQSIENFWTREHYFRKFGFLWKRGYLLHGPPGSGKTSTINIIIKKIVALNGIAIIGDHPRTDTEGLRIFRQIESDRPIVVILEDIDAILEHHGESSLLALLDGEVQIDNVIYMATTNYPEQLDKRFINRPSRFDFVKYIGMPSAEARKLYFEIKNPTLKENELQKWVTATKDLSIAHLKELIVNVECLGCSFDDTIRRLTKMDVDKVSSSDTSNKPFGFQSN